MAADASSNRVRPSSGHFGTTRTVDLATGLFGQLADEYSSIWSEGTDPRAETIEAWLKHLQAKVASDVEGVWNQGKEWDAAMWRACQKEVREELQALADARIRIARKVEIARIEHPHVSARCLLATGGDVSAALRMQEAQEALDRSRGLRDAIRSGNPGHANGGAPDAGPSAPRPASTATAPMTSDSLPALSPETQRKLTLKRQNFIEEQGFTGAYLGWPIKPLPFVPKPTPITPVGWRHNPFPATPAQAKATVEASPSLEKPAHAEVPPDMEDSLDFVAPTTAHRNDHQNLVAERRSALKAYKDECRSHGVKVTNPMIARAANPDWSERTPVEKWSAAKDSRYNTPAVDRKIRRVFTEKPHLPK
jgi:hypothetical protein